MGFRLFYVFALLLSFCLFNQCNGQMHKVKVSSEAYNLMLNTLLDRDVVEIDVQALAEIQSTVVLLDTRARREYEVSHLEGARYVGYDSFNLEMISDLKKDEEIVLYCSVGYRSEQITLMLRKAGFINVKNLFGGIFEWKNNGHAVVNMQEQETEEVHAYNPTWGIWLKKGTKIYQ